MLEFRHKFGSYNNSIEMIGNIKEQLGNKIDSKSSIYSSSNNITTTTKKTNLPENWLSIDLEPLKGIRFSLIQLKQLHAKSLNTPEVIQESINHFAYGLENNPKVKQYSDPLNVLMGVLRKGGSWFEANYESPQDKALREFTAYKKAQKEQREKMISDLVDIEFPEWERSLTESQRNTLLPESLLTSKIKAPVIAYLRQHFIKQVLMPRLVKEGLVRQEVIKDT